MKRPGKREMIDNGSSGRSSRAKHTDNLHNRTKETETITLSEPKTVISNNVSGDAEVDRRLFLRPTVPKQVIGGENTKRKQGAIHINMAGPPNEAAEGSGGSSITKEGSRLRREAEEKLEDLMSNKANISFEKERVSNL
ncbi:unnamed protein product [Cochlearia groenlandica]